MEYYYTNHQNQTQGPVTLEQLHALANSGGVGPSTMVSPVGSQQWSPVGTVIPALQVSQAVAPVTTDNLAIWSFILSILGLFCCAFFASIPAIICGHMSLSKIKANPSIPGKGLALAGVIIGYAGMAFWTIYIIIGLLGGWD